MANPTRADTPHVTAGHWIRPRTAAQTGMRTSTRVRVEQLVGRLYRAAELPLRARLLACLLRPLSPLALVAVAAGAFAGFVQRSGSAGAQWIIDDVARYSHEQVMELARFVEQVQPQALQEFAALIGDNAGRPAAFRTAAALLLMRTIQARTGSRDAG